jgi:hypothetical protein
MCSFIKYYEKRQKTPGARQLESTPSDTSLEKINNFLTLILLLMSSERVVDLKNIPAYSANFFSWKAY